MRYRIELAKEPKKFLEALRDAKLARRFSRTIESLAENPRPAGCLKLQGNDELHRVRVGDYRIIYQIRDAVLIVLVAEIGHRGDIYR
jgi:mRNA interferase RelE/StbE